MNPFLQFLLRAATVFTGAASFLPPSFARCEACFSINKSFSEREAEKTTARVLTRIRQNPNKPNSFDGCLPLSAPQNWSKLKEDQSVVGVYDFPDTSYLFLTDEAGNIFVVSAKGDKVDYVNPELVPRIMDRINLREFEPSDEFVQVDIRPLRAKSDVFDGASISFLLDGQWRHIHVDKNELDAMKKGELPNPHGEFSRFVRNLRLTKRTLVIWESPIAMKTMAFPCDFVTEIERIGAAIQTAYPDLLVVFDAPAASLANKIQAIKDCPIFDAPNNRCNLLALFDDVEGADDKGLRFPLKRAFQEVGIEVEFIKQDSKYMGKPGRGVIIVTAHNDEKLAQFIEVLGKGNYFKDNVVLFNSCQQPLRHDMLTTITQTYEASGCFIFEGRPTAVAVKTMLMDLVDKIRKKTQNGFIETVKEIIKGVNLKGLWRVCQLNVVQKSGGSNV